MRVRGCFLSCWSRIKFIRVFRTVSLLLLSGYGPGASAQLARRTMDTVKASIPQFSGEPNDWMMFKLDLQAYAFLMEIDLTPDKDGNIKLGKTAERKFAYIMWQAIPASWRVSHSHYLGDGVGLFQTLCARFESCAPVSKERARMKLMDVRQKNATKAEEYIGELCACIGRYELAGGKLEDEFKLERLVLGLTPEYGAIKDRYDAEASTMGWEGTVDLIRKKCIRLKALEEDAAKSSRALPAQKKFKGICNYCRRKGHKESECRKKKRDQSGPQPREEEARAPPQVKREVPQARRTMQSTITCYRCGRKGHRSYDCRASLDQHKAYIARRDSSSSVPSSTNARDEEEPTNHHVPIGLMMRYQCSMTASASALSQPGEWAVDSAADIHITPYREIISNFQPAREDMELLGIGGSRKIEGTGSIHANILDPFNGKVIRSCVLEAHYCSAAPCNILSTTKLRQSGHEFHDYIKHPSISLSDGTTIPLVDRGPYRVVQMAYDIPHPALISTRSDAERNEEEQDEQEERQDDDTSRAPLHIWHQRLTHAGWNKIKNMTNVVEGMEITTKKIPKEKCAPCALSKAKKLPFPNRQARRAGAPGLLLHHDTQGPFPTPSRQGNLYVAMFVDDFSRRKFPFFMKSKDEVGTATEAMLRKLKTQLNIDVPDITVRIDGAPELEKCFKDRQIKTEATSRDSPQQNGVAEQALTTMTTDSIASLLWAKLPDEFWEDAAENAIRIRNRLPMDACDGQTPHERWFNTKPNLAHVRTFGCQAYAHIPKSNRANKLDVRAVRGIHLGVAEGRKGYKIFNLDAESARHQIIVSRDVNFDEASPGGVLLNASMEHDDADADYVPDETVEVDYEQPLRRTTRPRRKPKEFWHVLVALNEPRSYKEAMNSNEAAQWKIAIEEELNNMTKANVWTVVHREEATTKPIPTTWNFRRKLDKYGDIQKYKARLCARGDLQGKESYRETYAPVAPSHMTKVFAAIALHIGALHKHVDVKHAYLNAPMDDAVYIHPPTGSGIPQGMVCRLNKSLYGT